jgi:hypothetical protein
MLHDHKKNTPYIVSKHHEHHHSESNYTTSEFSPINETVNTN